MRVRTHVLFSITVVLLSITVASAYLSRRETLVVSGVQSALPADGAEHEAFVVQLSGGGRIRADEMTPSADAVQVRVVSRGERLVGVVVRSPVNPGAQLVKVSYHGRIARVMLHFAADDNDSAEDGTPDFLRLHTAEDRAAFRAWFAALADTAASLPREQLPKEINDCAALLRWCYRGALHAHDAAWLETMPMETMPPLKSVAQYAYPFTPLGAGLFRVRAGPYVAGDAANGGFAQFADVKTLWQHNTIFVGRDVRTARTGDLLFYRQLEQNSPYHSMVLTGSAHEWAVYHTGPIGDGPGEVRRVLVTDLMHHPDTRWRPISQNSNFLGVYRWDILREDPR